MQHARPATHEAIPRKRQHAAAKAAHCMQQQQPTLLVEGSMLAPTAAAARSSGSNWRGGGTGWRRSSAQAGKCRSVNSATAVAGRGDGGESGGAPVQALLHCCQAPDPARLLLMGPGPCQPGVHKEHPPSLPDPPRPPPVQLARSIISSTIWLASRTCTGQQGRGGTAMR